MCFTRVCLLRKTYDIEIAEIEDTIRCIRRSCPMLASSLLLTNVESHKRASSERLLPDSDAANASLAKGLTMPTTDSIQIKPRDAGRLIMLFPYFSECVSKIKTLAGRRWHQQEKYWTLPKVNKAVTHLLTHFAGEPTEVGPSLDTAQAPQHKKPFPESPSVMVDQLRAALRARHYARRTEQAYGQWITWFDHFHHGLHPAEMAEPEINTSIVDRLAFAVRWTDFEPIQGGCVMPIRIRCRDNYHKHCNWLIMAKFVAYVSGEPMACYTGRNWQIRLLCGSA
jgi:hypothetical protein